MGTFGSNFEFKSGDRALKSIVDCFEVQPMYGTIGVGQKVSDYDQLRKVGDFTSDHRISNFKRCFPYNDKD